MRTLLIAIACSAVLGVSTACAAPAELVEFGACRDKPLVCYEYVGQIRTTQLASERQRLFVEREKIVLADWQAHRDHRLHALWSQYIQTWILMVIGIIIVGVGLAMSWMHMTRGLTGGAQADSALEVGKDGVRLSSPVIGLFVFGASIWFFTVYIDKVYALSLLPAETTAASQALDDKTTDKPHTPENSATTDIGKPAGNVVGAPASASKRPHD